jgi:hypothetical protein
MPQNSAWQCLSPTSPSAPAGDEESPGTETGGGGAGQVQEDTAGADTGKADAQAEVSAGAEVTVDDLLGNPTDYYGEQVTVSGEVGQILVDPGAFTLGSSVGGEGEADGEGAVGGEASSLLVLPTSQANVRRPEITESDVVKVQGTVQRVTANIAQEDDFLFEDAGDTGFLQDFQDQPGIMATRVDASVPQEDDATQE